MYTTFIFDLDGTIIDSEQIGLKALQNTLRAQGIEKEIGELRFALGIPGLRTLEILNIADIPTTLESWAAREKPFMKNVPIFPDMLEVITQLPKKGIVTSQTREELQSGFYHLGIEHHFQAIVSADDTIKHKPNPDPLEFGLHLMGCRPEETIYIGDSIYDLRCANAAGVDFGLALWGAKSRSEFEHAQYIFEKPKDILTLC